MKSQVTLFILTAILKFVLAFDLQRGSWLEVAFLDVGQGDGVLITTPRKERILIDGGSDYSADFQLSEYFPLNNCRLDAVVLTHPHADHVGGLNRILDHCKVESAFYNSVDYESGLYETWERKLKDKNIPTKGLVAGEKFRYGNVAFYSVWPTAKKVEKGFKNINNASIVLLMDYGDFEAFLTGDAEVEVLEYLYENWEFVSLRGLRGSKINGKLEVYKASHHGAENGMHEKLWRKLNPAVSVISVGEGNKFGHPGESVLEFFASEDALVRRTDIEGTVKIRYNSL